VTGFLIDGIGLRHALLLLTAGAALIGMAVLTSKGTHVFDASEATEPRRRLELVAATADG
jgi:hypothetical protein